MGETPSLRCILAKCVNELETAELRSEATSQSQNKGTDSRGSR